MSIITLIQRSLRFHWRAHLGVVLGAAVGAAALIGALMIGDSVRASLRGMALARLGRTVGAVDAGDRLFRAALADSVAPKNQTRVAPVLALPGSATVAGGTARANRIQVLGTSERFWNLAAERPAWKEIPRDAVVLNRALATQLGIARTGETVVLRFKKPAALAREATLATKTDADIAWRVPVVDILDDAKLGGFSLRVSQIPAANAFVNLAQLGELVQQTNQANMLLLGQGEGPNRFDHTNQVAAANGKLAEQWQLADAQLGVRILPGAKQVELTSSRIFLEPPVAQAALATTNGQPVLAYLVNLLQCGTNATPYSMVVALPPALLPEPLREDEILISQWLADDLHIGLGEEVQVTYFLMDSGVRLTERTNIFRVRGIVPKEAPLADRTLMPEFPGIAHAESTSDWDAGFPLVHKIRPKDDQYWKQYRGTPKAFLTLAAGQKLWANRYGNLTAVRFPIPAGMTAEAARADLEKGLLARLEPPQFGLQFIPVRQQALAAANDAQDFAELFLSFSFFLIVAALILTALMFRFGLEQRLPEAGLLLAVGHTPRTVRRLFLGEGLVLAMIGSLLGVAGGFGYAQAVLHGLTTIWKDATGFNALALQVLPPTLVIGVLASVAVAVFSLWLVLRKVGSQPATALLACQLGMPQKPAARRPWLSLAALAALAGALGMAGGALATGQTANAGLFFGSGSLLLISLIGLSRWWLGRITARPAGTGAFSLNALALQGCARRRSRSVATITLLACGCFLISAIGVFRLDAERDATRRASGTGGFALIGEASLPVLRDINTAEGRDFYSLPNSLATNAAIVSLRVRDGDEASCLNLNRAQRPRVLGVAPGALQARQAFSFAAVMRGARRADGWKLLERDYMKQICADWREDEIPAVGDAASIEWALKKGLGDTLEYVDERGQPFKLRLVGAVANSILQGSLLIDEAQFTRRFPSESGHRFFLIDVSAESLTPEARAKRVAEVSADLGRALQNTGLELTPAARRLAQFNAVQNTYLNTFQVLGALGLLLGTAGLAAVVLRNMLERRAELALLLAVGFRPDQLPQLVLREHGLLLVAGLGIGVLSAAIAVAPSLLVPGAEIPWRSLGFTLGLVLISGLGWTWLASRAAVRGNLLGALRNE